MGGKLGKLTPGAPDAPVRFGDYYLLGLLARGGMAEVYRARRIDAALGDVSSLLAIKVMRPSLAREARFVEMFDREAKLALLLRNACVVRTHEVGQAEGRHFITMEYVLGRDLTQLLRRAQDSGQRIPVPHAIYIAARIAEGLAFAHHVRDDSGRPLHIVNRDVSPSNVRLSYDGEVKLLDFGIAQALMAFTSEIGVLKGKFSYMSPEQIRGMPLDVRTDVFSAGIILHEMLTSEKLFRGDTEFALMEKVRKADVAPPSQWNPKVPRELDAIVMRALCRDVDGRYPNAAQLAADLDAVLVGYRFDIKELRQLIRQLFRKEYAEERAAAELAASSPVVAMPDDDVGMTTDGDDSDDAELEFLDDVEPEPNDDDNDPDEVARGSSVGSPEPTALEHSRPRRLVPNAAVTKAQFGGPAAAPQPPASAPLGPAASDTFPAGFTDTGILIQPPTATSPDAPTTQPSAAGASSRGRMATWFKKKRP